jgi:hypothetical protein
MLLDRSRESMLDSRYQLGRCLKGVLLLARGDYSGLAFLRDGLAWLREARVRFNYVQLLGAFAKGLGEAGQIAGARAAIDDAVEQAESREEFWCLP